MDDQIKLIKSYLTGIWLSKKYILIFAWIICPLGWVSVSMLPEQYTSKAIVYADTQSILKPLLRGLTIQTDPSQKLNLMAKTLLNSKNIETISKDIEANIIASTPQEYNKLLSELKSGIEINTTNKNNLYTISFTGGEPIYVRNVVQSALNVFIETTLGDKRLDTEEAQGVIEDQIAFYEARLVDEEQKLADFKRENLGLMPGSSNSYYANLLDEERSLEEAKFDLENVELSILELKKQLNQQADLPVSQDNNLKTEYDQRIEAIAIRLDDLLFKYTEKHPSVIETRKQLADLNKLKAQALKNIKVEDRFQYSPLYRELQIELSNLHNQKVSLNAKIEKHKDEIVELQQTLDYLPEVELKLTSLTRDYNITRNKYLDLLARGEKASILSNVESVTEDIKFRIIEAPNLPTSASGPNRTFYNIVVLVLGVGSGLVIALLASLLKPVASSIHQIQSQIGIPVIGVVSATQCSRLNAKTRNSTIGFMFFFILLIGLMAFFTLHNDLAFFIDKFNF